MIPKFRAWDKKWKRWILSQDIDYYGFEEEWYFDRRAKEDGDVIETAVGFKEIELEWSTGLKDKNGRPICENDIVIAGNRGTGTVEWFSGGFITRFDTRRHELINNHVEIIGNIHENKELLNGYN